MFYNKGRYGTAAEVIANDRPIFLVVALRFVEANFGARSMFAFQ